MLATLERIEILEESEELANMILQSDLAANYRACLNRLKTDQTAQKLIADFVSMKERYEEVQRFGKYHPDYRTVSLDIRKLKRQVDLHEAVAEFKRAEVDLQELLDEISRLLGYAVSDQIKVPSSNPFFHSLSSCSGGCGSGSCG